MTPDEQRLAFGINSVAPGERSVSPDQFLSLTGIRVPQEWALGELNTATQARDADDAEAALVVAAAFGMDTRWSGPLASLLQAEWHQLHEDVAFDLGVVGTDDAVPSLMHVVHWHPAYLNYDDGRALALKAIHSIAKICGPQAENALQSLLNDPNPEFRATIQRVLRRREG